jgi:hypothetical protein
VTDYAAAPVTLAGGISLLGYRLAQLDGQAAIELTWQATAPVVESFTAFVHVFDAAGQLLAQHDSPPALGRLPTPLWAVDVAVIDPHPIGALPAAAATWCFGLYDPVTLTRVPVVAGPGYNVHDDVACRPMATPSAVFP